MQSKMSLWNNALFKNLSRNIMFLTVINMICTFILIPFSYFMMDVEGTNNISKYIIGSASTSSLYFFGTMMYAILCGLFITYFFKSKHASDFIHSLPIKRQEILSTIYGTYFIHALLNLVINGVITLIFGIKFTGINIEKMLIWIALSLLLHLFIFSLTILLGLLINNYLSHIISVIAILISPIIMGTLIYTTHMRMFKGLSSYPEQFLNEITIPVKFMDFVVKDDYNFTYLCIIFLISVVMIAASYVIYNKRRNERINEAYANNTIHLVIYFITILIVTLLGGLIFSTLFNEMLIIAIIIYFISFTISYMLMEMSAQKSVRITFNKKLYSASLLVVGFALLSVYAAGLYREQYIPDERKVKNVAATFEGETGQYAMTSLLNDTKVSDPVFINNVIRSHSKLVAAQKAQYNNDYEVYNVHLKYTLNDGRIIDRNYDVYKKDYEHYIKSMNTEENKSILTKALDLSNRVNDTISIQHEISEGSYTGEGLNKKQKERLVKVLEASIKNKAFSSKLEAGRSKYAVTFEYENFNGTVYESGSYDVPISLYDKEVIAFLKQENFIDKYSDLLPEGKVYELPKSTDLSFASSVDSIKDIEGAKKVERKSFKAIVDENKIDEEGNHLYLIDNAERTFIFVK